MSVAPSTINQNPSQERFILAQLGEVILLFPSVLVTEILIIETAQLLALPFYPQGVLGCIQQGGQIVPLLSVDHLIGTKTRLGKEKLKVICLGENALNLKGVGIVVDQLLGSQEKEQISAEVLKTKTPITINQQTLWLFRPELFNEQIWQPQYWKQ